MEVVTKYIMKLVIYFICIYVAHANIITNQILSVQIDTYNSTVHVGDMIKIDIKADVKFTAEMYKNGNLMSQCINVEQCIFSDKTMNTTYQYMIYGNHMMMVHISEHVETRDDILLPQIIVAIFIISFLIIVPIFLIIILIGFAICPHYKRAEVI